MRKIELIFQEYLGLCLGYNIQNIGVRVQDWFFSQANCGAFEQNNQGLKIGFAVHLNKKFAKSS